MKNIRLHDFFKKKDDYSDEAVQFDKPVNRYYFSLSSDMNLISIILFIMLGIFTVVAFACNAKSITYENLFYMVKDINAAGEIAGSGGNGINYSASQSQDFAIYKKGLAVLGEQDMEIYTATGRKTLTSNVGFSRPNVLSSEKYVLAYDLGGNNVSLFNSFVEISHKIYDNPVYNAAISDSGYFAVVTRSAEYTSLVKVYNSNFSLVNDVGKNGHIIDIDINSDASHCAIVTLTLNDGEFVTELMVFKPGTENVSAQIRLGGLYPYQCRFLSDSRIALICRDITYVFDTDGEIVSRCFYTGKSISFAKCSDGCFALVYENDPVTHEYLLNVFDKNGKQIYNKTVNKVITDIELCGNYLFLLGTDNVCRVNLDSDKETYAECTDKSAKLLVINQNEVMVCTVNSAEYLNFKK